MEYRATQPVNLPVADFLKLEFYLMDAQPGTKPDAFVAELVHRWLAIELERLSLRERGHAMQGFQWKNVFLPEGTNLRTRFFATVEFAKVVGNHIVGDAGTAMTPSQFANQRAKGRNAWRFVWLRFPGDDYWIRADNFRMRTAELQSRQSRQSKSYAEPSNTV